MKEAFTTMTPLRCYESNVTGIQRSVATPSEPLSSQIIQDFHINLLFKVHEKAGLNFFPDEEKFSPAAIQANSRQAADIFF